MRLPRLAGHGRPVVGCRLLAGGKGMSGNKSPKTIATINFKGGVGKTTVTLTAQTLQKAGLINIGAATSAFWMMSVLRK